MVLLDGLNLVLVTGFTLIYFQGIITGESALMLNNTDGPYLSRQKREAKVKYPTIEEPRRRNMPQFKNIIDPYKVLALIKPIQPTDQKFQFTTARTTKLRHINKVPQPGPASEEPLVVVDDQNHSEEEYEESLETQRKAFEAYLESNHSKSNRTKETNEDQNIVLTFDHINQKYIIFDE